jgi:hypothetical protein
MEIFFVTYIFLVVFGTAMTCVFFRGANNGN